MKRRRIVATFAEARPMLKAAAELRASGLKIVDAHTPYALEEIEACIPEEKDRLSEACFAGGMLGLLLALAFQVWTSAVDWPLNVGGKPFVSLPALIPVAFEIAILFGALATLGVFLGRGRLGPGRVADPEFEPASDDRFVLVIEVLPGRRDRAVDVLESAGAEEIRPAGGGAP